MNNQTIAQNSILDEVENRFASLKKKISYRDRVIAEILQSGIPNKNRTNKVWLSKN